ncbi:UNVERIFIED_CONTAM: hypothetical protein RMT77_000676 [Armadillidium vulgare]
MEFQSKNNYLVEYVNSPSGSLLKKLLKPSCINDRKDTNKGIENIIESPPYIPQLCFSEMGVESCISGSASSTDQNKIKCNRHRRKEKPSFNEDKNRKGMKNKSKKMFTNIYDLIRIRKRRVTSATEISNNGVVNIKIDNFVQNILNNDDINDSENILLGNRSRKTNCGNNSIRENIEEVNAYIECENEVENPLLLPSSPKNCVFDPKIPDKESSELIKNNGDITNSVCSDSDNRIFTNKYNPNSFNSIHKISTNTKSSVTNSLREDEELDNKLRQSSLKISNFESLKDNTKLHKWKNTFNLDKSRNEHVSNNTSDEFKTADTSFMSQLSEIIDACIIDECADSDFTDIVKTYSRQTISKELLGKDHFSVMESSYFVCNSEFNQSSVSEILDYSTFMNDVQFLHSSSRNINSVDNDLVDCIRQTEQIPRENVCDISKINDVMQFNNSFVTLTPSIERELNCIYTEASVCDESTDEIIEYFTANTNFKTVSDVEDTERSSLCASYSFPLQNSSICYIPFFKKSFGNDNLPDKDTNDKKIAFYLKTSVSTPWPSVLDLIKFFEKLSPILE